MGKSQSKKVRLKAERDGRNNPEINRLQWQRKPQTQVVSNKKAEQRRTLCRRKGSREGADFFCGLSPRVTLRNDTSSWHISPTSSQRRTESPTAAPAS
ncbi:hypothetical protein FPZ45_03385 [Cohnella terricola]|uniref:Uncharacterized protein n=1 Tax=Cohnella terricola TaxID=1289167 RepID=A0A559JST4_9BACL|nr:hypothetical protein FPZ45_03385 [Cohnella terricola]